MNSNRPLAGRTVLVTGGTGFIGSRLVETLVLEQQARVRVLVRHFGRAAARIARLDVELLAGDVASPGAVERAMQGCEYVFHCAYGNSGGHKAQRRVNVEGTRAVLDAAVSLRPQAVVHVSTMSVYGRTPPGTLTESAPRGSTGEIYGATKAQAERLVLDYVRRRGVPAVVIQPTIVYGPYGGSWTLGPISRLKSGGVVFPKQGLGLCNSVYVDDVVSALLLAATQPAAVGECFLVSGGAPVTWLEFYDAYRQMLGLGPEVLNVTDEQLSPAFVWPWDDALQRGRRIQQELLRIWRESPRHRERWVTILKMSGIQDFIQQFVTETRWEQMKQWAVNLGDTAASKKATGRLLHIPRGFELSLMSSETRVSIEKAQKILGYSPKTTLKAGMDLTSAWAQWANLF